MTKLKSQKAIKTKTLYQLICLLNYAFNPNSIKILNKYSHISSEHKEPGHLR